MIVRVLASAPTITSSVTEVCTLEGQNVSLTCQVTYNGTNLMPLEMYFLTFPWHPDWVYGLLKGPGDHMRYIRTNNTVNASSVHQATWTLTATGQTTDACACRVESSYATGLVLHGVQQQYARGWGSATSPPFALKTVASERVFFTYCRCSVSSYHAYAR